VNLAIKETRPMSNTRTALLAAACCLLGAALAPTPAAARDTATCEGKRTWQRDIVEQTVRDWLDQKPDPARLVELIQAEQGIAACRAGRPARLHTLQLRRNLRPSQLGALLLANELEWRGLIAPPEEALAGKLFRISRRRDARPSPRQ
jgi:hypothetical protein